MTGEVTIQQSHSELVITSKVTRVVYDIKMIYKLVPKSSFCASVSFPQLFAGYLRPFYHRKERNCEVVFSHSARQGFI